jgi:hypothetical protein
MQAIQLYRKRLVSEVKYPTEISYQAVTQAISGARFWDTRSGNENLMNLIEVRESARKCDAV